VDLDRDVVARVLREAREVDATTAEPTESDGSARRCETTTTIDGEPVGCSSIRWP
jgi:hypothetical protein